MAKSSRIATLRVSRKRFDGSVALLDVWGSANYRMATHARKYYDLEQIELFDKDGVRLAIKPFDLNRYIWS